MSNYICISVSLCLQHPPPCSSLVSLSSLHRHPPSDHNAILLFPEDVGNPWRFSVDVSSGRRRPNHCEKSREFRVFMNHAQFFRTGSPIWSQLAWLTSVEQNRKYKTFEETYFCNFTDVAVFPNVGASFHLSASHWPALFSSRHQLFSTILCYMGS